MKAKKFRKKLKSSLAALVLGGTSLITGAFDESKAKAVQITVEADGQSHNYNFDITPDNPYFTKEQQDLVKEFLNAKDDEIWWDPDKRWLLGQAMLEMTRKQNVNPECCLLLQNELCRIFAKANRNPVFKEMLHKEMLRYVPELPKDDTPQNRLLFFWMTWFQSWLDEKRLYDTRENFDSKSEYYYYSPLYGKNLSLPQCLSELHVLSVNSGYHKVKHAKWLLRQGVFNYVYVKIINPYIYGWHVKDKYPVNVQRKREYPAINLEFEDDFEKYNGITINQYIDGPIFDLSAGKHITFKLLPDDFKYDSKPTSNETIKSKPVKSAKTKETKKIKQTQQEIVESEEIKKSESPKEIEQAQQKIVEQKEIKKSESPKEVEQVQQQTVEQKEIKKSESPKGVEQTQQEIIIDNLGANLVGIENTGNTCYINSLLQILQLDDKLCEKLKRSKPEKHPLHRVLSRIFGCLSDGKTIGNENLYGNLLSFLKHNGEQRDISEVLESLRTTYNVSFSSIHDVLLQESYDFGKPDQNANSHICVIGRTGLNGEKHCTPVELPQFIKREDGKKLYLTGYILHHGTGNGGHYTTVKLVNNTWYHCDDNSISEAKPNYLPDSDYVKQNVTLAFYKEDTSKNEEKKIEKLETIKEDKISNLIDIELSFNEDSNFKKYQIEPDKDYEIKKSGYADINFNGEKTGRAFKRSGTTPCYLKYNDIMYSVELDKNKTYNIIVNDGKVKFKSNGIPLEGVTEKNLTMTECQLGFFGTKNLKDYKLKINREYNIEVKNVSVGAKKNKYKADFIHFNNNNINLEIKSATKTYPCCVIHNKKVYLAQLDKTQKYTVTFTENNVIFKNSNGEVIEARTKELNEDKK